MKENPTRPKQYNLIDAMRLIAAFFVVTIHVPFPGDFGNIVIAVARFAVPFFFAVSGFFSYYEDNSVISGKIWHKIKHIFTLTIGSFCLYLFFNIIVNALNGWLGIFLRSLFTVKTITAFLVFNQPFGVSVSLWFLPSLIYTYIAFFILKKIKRGGVEKNLSLFLFLFLSIIGVLLRELPELIPNAPEFLNNVFLYRNFLFIGIPFFFLGYYIRINQRIIIEKFTNPLLIVLILIGTAESVAVNSLHIGKDVYLGTIIVVFALFILIIKLEDKVNVKHLAQLGRKYSFYIYIFHTLIKILSTKLETAIPVYGKIFEFLNPVRPIVIFAITLTVSAVYVYIKNSFKKVKIRSEK